MSPVLFALWVLPFNLSLLRLLRFFSSATAYPCYATGRSVTEFKKGVAGIEEEIDAAVKESTKKTTTEKDDSEE